MHDCVRVSLCTCVLHVMCVHVMCVHVMCVHVMCVHVMCVHIMCNLVEAHSYGIRVNESVCNCYRV